MLIDIIEIRRDFDDVFLGLSAFLVLGPLDDLFLQLPAAVDEIVAVAGDADDKVAVLLRVHLGIAEGIGRDDVEPDRVRLNLMKPSIAIIRGRVIWVLNRLIEKPIDKPKE